MKGKEKEEKEMLRIPFQFEIPFEFVAWIQSMVHTTQPHLMNAIRYHTSHTCTHYPSHHQITHRHIRPLHSHTPSPTSRPHTRIHTIKSQSIDERRRLYVQGGVMFVAARMVVVDMLLNRLPPHLVCIIECIHMYSWALPRTIH